MSYKTGADLTEEARAQIREVSPAEVKAMVEKKENVVYLDVREPNEWNLGRIPGAVHLPRGNLESKLEGMVDRAKKIVVYCARGNRSALAALTMKEMGYDDVVSMSQGFIGWADVGGPVEG
jgi:rhodanese-related sulfurtransferase